MLAYLEYTPLVTIDIGPLSISPHGIGIAVGYLVGAYVMLPEARRKGMSEEHLWSILTLVVPGVLIGARMAYVINHLGEFDNPLEWFKVWEGGISLLGGIFGGIVIALPRIRRYGYSVWKVLDAAAAGLVVGIIIGRTGDLVVADHLGKTTEFFLGYVCPPVETASRCIAPVGEAVHQPALYDLFNVLMMLPVFLWLRRRPLYDGFQILLFGAWYGAGRLVEDFFRIDVTHGTGLTGSQWAAVVTMVACLYVLLFVRDTPRRRVET